MINVQIAPGLPLTKVFGGLGSVGKQTISNPFRNSTKEFLFTLLRSWHFNICCPSLSESLVVRHVLRTITAFDNGKTLFVTALLIVKDTWGDIGEDAVHLGYGRTTLE